MPFLASGQLPIHRTINTIDGTYHLPPSVLSNIVPFHSLLPFIMTIKDWWDNALGTFKADEPFQDLSEFQGKRFAVDISIFLNKFLRSDVDRLVSTSSPPYPCPDLLHLVIDFHSKVSKVICPIYVFDGVAPNVKEQTKAQYRTLLLLYQLSYFHQRIGIT